jgi:hypothetical protein
MALSIVNGAGITVAALYQSSNGYISQSAIGVGYWYNNGSYRALISRYSFTVAYPCSEIRVTLAYTEADSDYTAKPFYAGVSTGDSAWGSYPHEDTQYFSAGKSAAFTVTRAAGSYFQPGTTYYLYIGSQNSGSPGSPGTRYNTNSYGDLTASFATTSAGLAHIDTGSGWENYLVYIDNATSWEQVIPYVDSGTEWDICT